MFGMEINNMQFTQIKYGKIELLIQENAVEVGHYTVEAKEIHNPALEHFTIIFTEVLDKSLLEENDELFFIDRVAIGLTNVEGQMYGFYQYSNTFPTIEEERKFMEYLIHREDVLESSKKYEVLYKYLKEKPRLDGYTIMEKFYDESAGKMKDMVMYVDYDEEDDEEKRIFY